MHDDPSVYNNCFLLSKIDTKNRLRNCTKTYIHHLSTYIAFLLNKMHFYQEYYHEGRFQKHLNEGLSLNSLKNLVFGNHKYMMHTQKEHAQLIPYMPYNYNTPVTHHLIMPTELLKQPTGTQTKL